MYLKARQLQKLALSPVLFLAMLSSDAVANDRPNMTNMVPGVTELGREIYDLHMLVMWICIIVGIGVFGFMFYSMFAYRKSKGHQPANFHENIVAELAWTIIPTIILVLMAVPASSTLIKLYDVEDADLDILITGYQWKWKYKYLLEDGEPVEYFSNLRTPQSEILGEDVKGEHYLLEVDNPLYIPVNKKTRFLITANDVIHAWWVPHLAVKKDAIPGFINETWARPLETGVLRGQCAELCGKDHGFMPIVVNVVEQAEFDSFIADKQQQAAALAEMIKLEKTMDELMAEGKSVYDGKCAACHGMAGEGGVGPAIAGSAVAMGPLDKHLDIGVNGIPGTMMQAFGQQINDVEMAAVITYQRNAFGNNMGEKVQPIDVYQFKNQ
ncbi:MAG: cytochrome c oxidase subunit II [Pseudomonadales bacterium]|nr:cytochrome c oxidase subunit II [Pseudomonadales bacterium]